FSRDWKKLACGNYPGAVFLDFETGKVLQRIAIPDSKLVKVGFSPDGKLMLWGTVEETTISDGASFEKRFAGSRAVLSPDGKMLATSTNAEHALKLWDVKSGSELRTWPDVAFSKVFSPDGRRLAISGNADAYIWD